ncbi:hypothetical protein XENOCAPTIV_008209, partial [Xenoophorus captivus]
MYFKVLACLLGGEPDQGPLGLLKGLLGKFKETVTVSTTHTHPGGGAERAAGAYADKLLIQLLLFFHKHAVAEMLLLTFKHKAAAWHTRAPGLQITQLLGRFH